MILTSDTYLLNPGRFYEDTHRSEILAPLACFAFPLRQLTNMLDAETHLLVTPEAAEAFQYQTSMLFDPLEDPLTKTALPIAALSVMHRIACRGSKWRVIGLVTVLDVLATLTHGTLFCA